MVRSDMMSALSESCTVVSGLEMPAYSITVDASSLVTATTISESVTAPDICM